MDPNGHTNTQMDPNWHTQDPNGHTNTQMDPNGHPNGPKWRPRWTQMDTQINLMDHLDCMFITNYIFMYINDVIW